MPTDENVNIAVLIDAENVDPAYAEHIFSYARSLGNVCIREIYGSGISLNEWADPILINSIHTNFTLRPNRFKNSSDICLVIGAMEILSANRHGGRDAIAAVVIASSDSDFSALAVHLRSAGIDVIGMGEAGRCNPMWPRSCTDFIALEARTPLVRRREDAAAPASAVNPVQEPKTEPVPAEKTEEIPAQAVEKPKPAEASNGSQKKKGTENRKEQKKENKAAESGKTEPDKNAVADQNPAAGKKAEAEKARKKKDVPRISPTHKARVESIRALIAEQIASHDGRIRSGDLFRVLGSNPEYKYDQQRSRRNPMDYLRKQYGTWFDFEPGENGASWITLKASPQPEQVEETVASEPENAEGPVAETETNAEFVSEPESAAEPVSEQASTAEPVIEPESETEPVSEPETTTEPVAKPESETEPVSEPETTAEPVAKPESETEPVSEPDTTVESVTKPENAAASVSEPESKAEPEPAAEPVPEPEPVAKPVSEAKTGNRSGAKKKGAKKEKQTAKKPALSPFAQQLADAGIPQQDAEAVAEVLSQCRHYRDSYNHLRQTFGNEKGKQYQQMIKDANIQFGKT